MPNLKMSIFVTMVTISAFAAIPAMAVDLVDKGFLIGPNTGESCELRSTIGSERKISLFYQSTGISDKEPIAVASAPRVGLTTYGSMVIRISKEETVDLHKILRTQIYQSGTIKIQDLTVIGPSNGEIQQWTEIGGNNIGIVCP